MSPVGRRIRSHRILEGSSPVLHAIMFWAGKLTGIGLVCIQLACLAATDMYLLELRKAPCHRKEHRPEQLEIMNLAQKVYRSPDWSMTRSDQEQRLVCNQL